MRRVLFNCYDSHVHWTATGEHQERLQLYSLKSSADVASLKVQSSHFRENWLVGWGWDQNKWSAPQFPDRKILDQVFPDHPVAFIRADGHAVWVNSLVIEKLSPKDLQEFDNNPGGRVLRDSSEAPTGVLLDHAMSLVKDLIPKPSSSQIRSWLLKGMQIFNRNGFTHIRDLTCEPSQWNEARRLEKEGLLTLAVEQYFDADPFEKFDEALSAAKAARNDKSHLLRVKGIKVYYDGALGSEGALISHSYRSGQSGLQLMTPDQFAYAAEKTWDAGFELAIHVIGDRAAHDVATKAVELWSKGRKGILHLEHAELLRPDTIELLKGRSVRCHIQPCHWLTDHHWLEEKVGSLNQHAFPWAKLQESGIDFDFGSDSPIEEPRLQATLDGVEHSRQNGIAALKGDPLSFHEHSDRSWTPGTSTVWENNQIKSVTFMNIPIF